MSSGEDPYAEATETAKLNMAIDIVSETFQRFDASCQHDLTVMGRVAGLIIAYLARRAGCPVTEVLEMVRDYAFRYFDDSVSSPPALFYDSEVADAERNQN